MHIDELFLFTFSFPTSHEARAWLKGERWGFKLLQQVDDGDGAEAGGNFVCVGSSHVMTESFLHGCTSSSSCTPEDSVPGMATSPSKLEECGIQLTRQKGWSWSNSETGLAEDRDPQVVVSSTATISPAQSLPPVKTGGFAFDNEPVVDYPMGIWPRQDVEAEQQGCGDQEAEQQRCGDQEEVHSAGCVEEIGVEYPMGWPTMDASASSSMQATSGSTTTGQERETRGNGQTTGDQPAPAAIGGALQKEAGIQTAWRDGAWLEPKQLLNPQPHDCTAQKDDAHEKSPLFTRPSAKLPPPPGIKPPLSKLLFSKSITKPVKLVEPAPPSLGDQVRSKLPVAANAERGENEFKNAKRRVSEERKKTLTNDRPQFSVSDDELIPPPSAEQLRDAIAGLNQDSLEHIAALVKLRYNCVVSSNADYLFREVPALLSPPGPAEAIAAISGIDPQMRGVLCPCRCGVHLSIGCCDSVVKRQTTPRGGGLGQDGPCR